MTVLRSGISAHTTVVTVDAPLSNPSYPIFYDLDSETIKVVDGADTTEWQVERGVADTQQARHAKNVLLVANASPFGGGGGGVSVDNGVDPPTAVTSVIAPGAVIAGSEADLSGLLQFRRLGPYSLTYTDLGVAAQYVVLAAGGLPAGAMIQAFAFCRENFGGTGLSYAFLGVYIHNSTQVASFDVNAADAQAAPDEVSGVPGDFSSVPGYALGSDAALGIKVNLVTDASALNAGAVDVVIVILTPAS